MRTANEDERVARETEGNEGRRSQELTYVAESQTVKQEEGRKQQEA